MEMYSPIRGKVKSDEEVLQAGMTIRKASPEEIERELAKWGERLQPMTSSRRRKSGKRSNRNTITFGGALGK